MAKDESLQVRGESEAFSVKFTCEGTGKHSELKTLCPVVYLQDNHVNYKLCENADACGGQSKMDMRKWVMNNGGKTSNTPKVTGSFQNK